MADERLKHSPPEPLRHLSTVLGVTQRSQQIAQAALYEALTQPISPGRVDQLRKVANDLDREVARLELALELDDAPIVREDDPPVALLCAPFPARKQKGE